MRLQLDTTAPRLSRREPAFHVIRWPGEWTVCLPWAAIRVTW
ncbi:hypothetical protein [Jannaschia sp. 2305UL9-9]